MQRQSERAVACIFAIINMAASDAETTIKFFIKFGDIYDSMHLYPSYFFGLNMFFEYRYKNVIAER